MTFKEEMAEMGANVEKKLLSLMRKEEEEELETAVNFLPDQYGSRKSEDTAKVCLVLRFRERKCSGS
jgi:Mg/Co/Ni transporter MgtE